MTPVRSLRPPPSGKAGRRVLLDPGRPGIHLLDLPTSRTKGRHVSPVASAQTLEERCIDTIRFLAVDGVQKAKSGHPGMPMGAAAVAHTLFTRHLRFDPADPAWPDRDRFVLSAGHGTMLLYSLLHLTGYDLPRRPAVPSASGAAGRPATPSTGTPPASRRPPARSARASPTPSAWPSPSASSARPSTATAGVVDHFTYVLAGDGDMMEGISSEAASLAGHLKLGKLIVLYDDNHITIDGPTDLAFTEDVCARFEAYGWHVQKVADGNDLEAIDAAIAAAKAETGSRRYRRAHPHRLRLAEQAGHRRRARRAARRGRGQADQGEPAAGRSSRRSSCPTT